MNVHLIPQSPATLVHDLPRSQLVFSIHFIFWTEKNFEAWN